MGRNRNLSNLVSDNMLSVDTSGNIGLGNETPSKSLDVVGILSTTTFSGNHYPGTIETSNTFTKNLNTTGIITTTGMFYGDGRSLTGIAFTCAAIVADVKSSGTNAGNPDPSGQWKHRDLQTIISDPHNIISSLSGNKFALGPGIYQIHAIVPTLRTNSTQVAITILDSAGEFIVNGGTGGSSWSQQSSWFAGDNLTVTTAILGWSVGIMTCGVLYINEYAGIDQQMGLGMGWGNEYYTQAYILKGNI